MQSRVILISDDVNFFEFIIPRLNIRKRDELFRFSYDDILDKVNYLQSSLIIINSDNSEERCLELLEIIKGTPVLVFYHNENENFKLKTLELGAYDYINLLVSQEELSVKFKNALAFLQNIIIARRYREILVDKKIISDNNEVYIDYDNVLKNQIDIIHKNSIPAVLLVISPSDKTKFEVNQNQIETIILNNIRKNDLLINYSPNKYFLLLYNTEINFAQKVWEKINNVIPNKLFVGFCEIKNKKKEQVINEALNKLHENINKTKENKAVKCSISNNYKLYKEDFLKNFEKTVIPVFYQMQQKYSYKILGAKIEHFCKEGQANFKIFYRNIEKRVIITTPGLTKVIVDIEFLLNNELLENKRMTFEIDEFEASLLEDILEQIFLEND